MGEKKLKCGMILSVEFLVGVRHRESVIQHIAVSKPMGYTQL
jgi:hypothetical protein